MMNHFAIIMLLFDKSFDASRTLNFKCAHFPRVLISIRYLKLLKMTNLESEVFSENAEHEIVCTRRIVDLRQIFYHSHDRPEFSGPQPIVG